MKSIGFIMISKRRYGGAVYGARVQEMLSRFYQVEGKDVGAAYVNLRYLKPLEWFFRFFLLRGEKDLWVTQSFLVVVALSLSRIKGKKLAIIYHIDNSVFSRIFRSIFFVLETTFYQKLKNYDAIVTISEYWKDFFVRKGYRNVYKVYPGFQVDEFDISDQEVTDWKKRFGLGGKPIIYIGNCLKAKGVRESYEALKDLDVELVTSGEKRVDIPATNLNVSYRDYLCLLKASSVVVTMSKFKEGWCMTAHEAMLLKTPVIGSGLGGMRELLEGGEQIICESFDSLKSKVEFLLSRPEEARRLGERGYEFAKQFTLERFAKSWQQLVRDLL